QSPYCPRDRPGYPGVGPSPGGNRHRVTPRALAQRRRVLFTMLTTLGFRYPRGREPLVITGIRQYLGSWPGVGRIVAGMARQQYLRLTRHGGHGWEATFYPAGIGHSLTPMVGAGWVSEPAAAVQPGGVGGAAAGGGCGGLMDLTGKYLGVWLSAEARARIDPKAVDVGGFASSRAGVGVFGGAPSIQARHGRRMHPAGRGALTR